MVNAHVAQEPAFLLHSRNFTDTRILLEFFTENHGRIKTVYRLAQKKKVPFTRPQPFTPMLLDLSGQSELKTLRHLELTAAPLLTAGSSLFCGLYLNELLQKLLPLDSEHRSLFVHYHAALLQLGSVEPGWEDVPLRMFELQLLEVLGYAVVFDNDVNGDSILDKSGRQYSYVPSEGFVPHHDAVAKGTLVCSSETLRGISEEHWDKPEVRLLAKKICRKAIQELLGGYQLKSREFFL